MAARLRVTLALAGVAVLWVGLVAAMTQAGFSGNARYFLPAVVLACVLAGVGAAGLAEAAGRPAAASPVIGRARAGGRRRTSTAGRRRSRIRRAAPSAWPACTATSRPAVRGAGGRDAVVARGAPRVNRAFMTSLRGRQGSPIGEVERARGRGSCSRRRRPGGAAGGGPPGSRSLAPSESRRAWQVLVAAPQSVIAALKRGDADVNGNGTLR